MIITLVSDNKFFWENENVKTVQSNISELFSDYFSRIALGISLDECVTSRCDAASKHNSRPGFAKIWHNRKQSESANLRRA